MARSAHGINHTSREAPGPDDAIVVKLQAAIDRGDSFPQIVQMVRQDGRMPDADFVKRLKKVIRYRDAGGKGARAVTREELNRAKDSSRIARRPPDVSQAPKRTSSRPTPAATPSYPLSFSGRVGDAVDRIGALTENKLFDMKAGVDHSLASASGALGLNALEKHFLEEVKIANAAQRPVEGATSWEQVKSNPTIGNVISFGAEQGISSIPETLAAVYSAPLYLASRAGNLAHDRALKRGRERAEGEDYLYALPSSIAALAMERFQPGESGGLFSVAKEGLEEGLKEGSKRLADYGAVNADVGANFDPQGAAEAGDVFLSGMAAGFPFGVGKKSIRVAPQSSARAFKNGWELAGERAAENILDAPHMKGYILRENARRSSHTGETPR